MRIGVISDSHGDIKSIRQGLKQMGEVSLLLHAGDHCGDVAAACPTGSIPINTVRGNCDWGGDAPGQQIIDCAGKKILLLHGHLYNVKRTYSALIAYAQTVGPDLVVFGHTHVPAFFTVGNTVFFNPGSIACPRGMELPSFGVIDVTKDGLAPHLFSLRVVKRYFRFF